MSAALVIAIGTALAAVLGAVLGGKNTMAVLHMLRGHADSATKLDKIARDVHAIRDAVVTMDARVTRLEVRDDSRRVQLVANGGE